MDAVTLREDMVDSLEHEAKGLVSSERVSIAMREVPREAFVTDERTAYEDRDSEAHGSRVLAPSTVARLLEALAAGPGDDVLVVGSGVGYTAAVLAEIAGEAEVHAVDIDRRLVLVARGNLAEAGYGGVFVDRRDGADGWPEYAPYDRILLEAAAVAPPPGLLDQLADDGRLVMPMGLPDQSLVAVEPAADAGDGRPGDRGHHGDGVRPRGGGDAGADVDGGAVAERFGPVRFDPLLVAGEEAGAIERNRTAREERERAARAAERRKGWEHDWIDWEAEGY